MNVLTHGPRFVSEHVGEPGVARLVVSITSVLGPSNQTLLVDGLFEVVSFLAGDADQDAQRRIIDVRVSSDLPVPERAIAEAFVNAVRGLIQCRVLETHATGTKALFNAVVSDDSGSGSREVTLQYLSDAHGGFSVGSVIDLRGDK